MELAPSLSRILDCGSFRAVRDPQGWMSRPEEVRLERIADLEQSSSGSIAFYFSKDYRSALLRASPSVLVVGEAVLSTIPGGADPSEEIQGPLRGALILASPDPYGAMARVSGVFSESRVDSHRFTHSANGAGSKASVAALGGSPIHPSALLENGVELLGPVCISEGAKIGSGSVLYPGVFVGRNARIGRHCVLFPNVVLYEGVILGDRVRVHAQTVLGADGFGYAPLKTDRGVEHQKIYHLGGLQIGDNVELGAAVTIDRGTFSDTRVGAGTKIDNHVHIGHNAQIGQGVIICGGVCLAGHARIEDFAVLGGMSGVTNQVQVGAGAQVAAMSLVSKDVPPGQIVAGNPQRPYAEHFKVHAFLNRLFKKGL